MEPIVQVASVLGAIQVLIAYVASQTGRMSTRGATYNLLNLAGSALLTWAAVVQWNLGFVLLEGVWAVVSLWALVKRA